MSKQWPGTGFDPGFESLARQYWSAWGDAMRGIAPGHAVPGTGGPGGAMPNWQDAIDWWSRLAHGGREEANAAVDRFNAQARNWYGQMQQVAARFAGQDAKPADITAEWKRALGAMGENPFPEMFRAMRGQGAQGLDQWIEDASPWLDAWRREGNAWLGMPTFGLGREHQARWQKLAQAQLDYQQRESTYNALMMKAAQRAYEVFEGKLAEREEPGRQLTSARALFDLWIDAAEEAYAEIALSPQFREAYGARINAQMRLRGAVQGEVERMSAMFGMPTQGDLDIAFRKIAELERSLRRLRDQMATGPAPARTSSKPEPSPKPAAKKKPATRSGLKAAPPQASTGKGRQR